ncbi:MAG TPA: futalosine hydrolase [Dissulfurispiraceae bacterium]|nr:futalosine hydrolase [Dissulfurispiraceae bacterium]
MKPVGIIIPTQIEAGVLVRRISERKETAAQSRLFYEGFINKKPVVFCLCGIGKTNAAHGVTLLIERFGPSIVYMIGVAGAYPSSGLEIGESVVAEREVYGDEGLMLGTEFKGMAGLGLALADVGGKRYYNEFPLLVPDALKDCRHKGTFVTVSSCTGTLRLGREMEQRYGAICENMEGAAIAHICLLNGVPAAEIRGISNIIGDREGKPLDRSAILKASENVQEYFLERLFRRD